MQINVGDNVSKQQQLQITSGVPWVLIIARASCILFRSFQT